MTVNTEASQHCATDVTFFPINIMKVEHWIKLKKRYMLA